MNDYISILSPLYNCESDIPYFLRNSRENYNDYRYHYIANDGSTDKTHKIVEEAIAGTERVYYFNDGRNIGPHNRSTFLHEQVQTPFIMGLCHDDFIVPSFLEKANKVIAENPDVGMVMGDLLYIDETGNYYGLARPAVDISGRVIKGHEFIDKFMVPNGPYHSQDGATILNLHKLLSVYCDNALRRAGAMFFDTFNHQLVGIKYGAYHIGEVAHVLKRHDASKSSRDAHNNPTSVKRLFLESIDDVVEHGVLSRDYAEHMKEVFK